MPSVVEILTLSTLVVIAVELVLLRRDLGKRESPARAEREPGEAQVINVNLGTAPQSGAATGPAAIPVSVERFREGAVATGSETAAPDADDAQHAAPEELREAPRRVAPAPRPTGSGLVAVPCPKCKAENSSYRTECFNCGASLR